MEAVQCCGNISRAGSEGDNMLHACLARLHTLILTSYPSFVQTASLAVEWAMNRFGPVQSRSSLPEPLSPLGITTKSRPPMPLTAGKVRKRDHSYVTFQIGHATVVNPQYRALSLSLNCNTSGILMASVARRGLCVTAFCRTGSCPNMPYRHTACV
jgi:hypothetical protein